jgi:hypothetical protein
MIVVFSCIAVARKGATSMSELVRFQKERELPNGE